MSSGSEGEPTAQVEALDLLVDVIGQIVAAQRELLEAVGELQSDITRLTVAAGLDEMGYHAAGLRAQAHQSYLQSSRLIERAARLTARAQELQEQAEELVSGSGTRPPRAV